MIKEHDRIVLSKDLPAEGLLVGDVGTVVHIHNKGEAFEVEFMTLEGEVQIKRLDGQKFVDTSLCSLLPFS
jgi:Domain of unknown function (DUF4926)